MSAEHKEPPSIGELERANVEWGRNHPLSSWIADRGTPEILRNNLTYSLGLLVIAATAAVETATVVPARRLAKRFKGGEENGKTRS